MNELQTPTWDNVKTECDALEQMASQTVLKACDIGDMLREIRATMDVEKFELHCNSYLSRELDWANKMMLLSFRRSELVKVLSDGEANDSIRSAYSAVKSLPKSDEEKAERNGWPRKKAGRPKGSKDKGKAVTSDQKQPLEAKKVKQFGWKKYAVESGFLQANPGGVAARKARERIEKELGSEVPQKAISADDEQVEPIKQVIDKLAAEKNIEKAKQDASTAKSELSKTAQQKLEIAIRKHVAVIQADAQKKVAEEVRRQLALKEEDFKRREKALIDQQAKADAMVEKYRKLMARQINGFDASQAFKTLKQIAHPDRCAGNPKLAQNAMHIIKELEGIFS